ncbi:MAG: hypothetical protein NTY20_02495 [Candidatus Aenigmarchaeota archaeon]|nr:hypothetical protein [Candidatus Aenigmarchaeota archaeon]
MESGTQLSFYTPDQEARIYTKCRDAENVLWYKILHPLVNEVNRNIFLAETHHSKMESLVKRLINVFGAGCKTRGYGFKYNEGPVTQAFDEIESVNKKIQCYNEDWCAAVRLMKKEFGLPQLLPYIEIGKEYERFDKAKEYSEESFYRRNEEFFWSVSQPVRMPK